MKKHKPNNKLVFNKAAVTELNDDFLKDINGGSSLECVIASVALYYMITMDIHNEHHK